MARFQNKLKLADELPRRCVLAIGEEWLEKNKEVVQEIRSWEGGNFGTTQRKNGQTVTGQPRDIVDTGKLLNSLKIATIDNTVRLSMSSHGKYVIMGSNGVPPRPFHLIAAERINYKNAKLD